MLNKSTFYIGSGFGSGLLPLAPGTWGSLFAAGIGFGGVVYLGPLVIPVLFILSLIGGFLSAPAYIKEFGADPASFVMDEWCGQFLALHIIFFLPADVGTHHLILIFGLSFLSFRLFDILKPLGIKKIDAIEGVAGVMLDDIAAGLYTFLTLFFVILAIL